MKLSEVFIDREPPEDVAQQAAWDKRQERMRRQHADDPSYFDEPESAVDDDETDEELDQAITALNIAKQNLRFHANRMQDSRSSPEQKEESNRKAQLLAAKVEKLQHAIDHWNDPEADF